MDHRARSLAFGALIALAARGGDDEQPAPSPPATREEPPPVEAPVPVVDEACAQVVVVAWQGAVAAAETVTRTEDEARAKAEALRGRIDGGEDFALLARAESD